MQCIQYLEYWRASMPSNKPTPIHPLGVAGSPTQANQLTILLPTTNWHSHTSAFKKTHILTHSQFHTHPPSLKVLFCLNLCSFISLSPLFHLFFILQPVARWLLGLLKYFKSTASCWLSYSGTQYKTGKFIFWSFVACHQTHMFCAYCTSGDCLTSRPESCSRPRELWFSIHLCVSYIKMINRQCWSIWL